MEAVVRYYLGARDFLEVQFRARVTRHALADPEAFWRGDVVQLAPTAKREMGIASALAASYRHHMECRLSEWQDALEIMDLEHTRSFVATIFESWAGDAVLSECARAEIEYLETKLQRPGSVLYELPPDEAQSPVVSASDAANVPLLSAAVSKWRPLKIREGWSDTRMVSDPSRLRLCGLGGERRIG